MTRSLMFSLVAVVSIISCQAMQDKREKPFVCESEIGDIHGTTKRITDEYITDSGARYYRQRT